MSSRDEDGSKAWPAVYQVMQQDNRVRDRADMNDEWAFTRYQVNVGLALKI
jgi:hypothetical protein